LFERIDTLEVECRDRFALWFAHHLSNFNFVWPWNSWVNAVNLDDDSPKKVFIREVLEREIRLSYWDRVQTTVTVSFEHLMPPHPNPEFPYDKQSASSSDEVYVNLAPSISKQLREKTKPSFTISWLENQASLTTPISRLRLVWPCLLNLGAKSFTHTTALLERHRDVIKALNGDPAAQSYMVQAVGDFWRNSTLHIVIILDKLVTSHLLTPGPVVSWIFSQTQHKRHRQFLWEILHNTVEKTVLRVERAKQQSLSNKKSVDDSQEDLAVVELQDMFVLMFRHFQKALTERLTVDQDEMSHAYSHLASRLVQFGRMFHNDIAPFQTQIEKLVFSQEVDDRITNLFHISQNL